MAHLLLRVVGTPWLLLALLHILKSSLIRWIFTRWLRLTIVVVIPIIPLMLVGPILSLLLLCTSWMLIEIAIIVRWWKSLLKAIELPLSLLLFMLKSEIIGWSPSLVEWRLLIGGILVTRLELQWIHFDVYLIDARNSRRNDAGIILISAFPNCDRCPPHCHSANVAPDRYGWRFSPDARCA